MKAKTHENMTPIKAVMPPSSLSVESVPVEEEINDKSGAECIALKCEEKGCQFITAWDSEMQRHLSEAHDSTDSTNKPKKKPLPMLIPLSSVSNAKTNNSSPTGSPSTLLKVPRVRVKPELAQIARDHELAKLQANKVFQMCKNTVLILRKISSYNFIFKYCLIFKTKKLQNIVLRSVIK